MKNILSIDLEDWFCVNNFQNIIKREDWHKCELRVYDNTKRILDLLDKYNAKATFFVLGWLAEKLPALIHEINQAGHEIASHGYHHMPLTQLNPIEFENDLVKSIDIIHKCNITQPIIGYRAPSFTIVNETKKWVLPILEKHNIQYDSSIFPIQFHPDYGIEDAPLYPYKITKKLYEFPIACARIFSINLPCGGGGYFRLFPYQYTKRCIKHCNSQSRPVVFYLHPWEIDPQQPKVDLPLLKRFRHYYGLSKTIKKLEYLLNDFQFITFKEYLNPYSSSATYAQHY